MNDNYLPEKELRTKCPARNSPYLLANKPKTRNIGRQSARLAADAPAAGHKLTRPAAGGTLSRELAATVELDPRRQ